MLCEILIELKQNLLSTKVLHVQAFNVELKFIISLA
jgi:hypothetical protein